MSSLFLSFLFLTHEHSQSHLCPYVSLFSHSRFAHFMCVFHKHVRFLVLSILLLILSFSTCLFWENDIFPLSHSSILSHLSLCAVSLLLIWYILSMPWIYIFLVLPLTDFSLLFFVSYVPPILELYVFSWTRIAFRRRFSFRCHLPSLPSNPSVSECNVIITE